MGFEFCHPAVNFIFFTAVLYGSIAFSHPVFLAIACAAACSILVRNSKGNSMPPLLSLLPPSIPHLAAYFSIDA